MAPTVAAADACTGEATRDVAVPIRVCGGEEKEEALEDAAIGATTEATADAIDAPAPAEDEAAAAAECV